ncbi:hypothetical protein [Streptomyces roseolus]|uniref:hypothetical protein n=1 Tax=Streptomyces roseolus TaxID=67358 RepID=UPI0037A745D3
MTGHDLRTACLVITALAAAGTSCPRIAVTVRSNWAKADKDPAQWMRSAPSARCRYATEWTVTKLRWNLSVGPAEAATLQAIAAECG